jgi:RNA polymerase sigma factor (sigma-70 family)
MEPDRHEVRFTSMGEETRVRAIGGHSERLEGSRLADAYARHFPGAVRLAFLLTGDRELAKDLAQDAFVKLAGRYFHYRGDAGFDAYLRQTVVNLARSHGRRRRVEADRVERLKAEPPATIVTSDPVERQDGLRLLALLTPRQRAAVVLRLYEDLSEQETATLLACRPGTVKSLLSRAMDVLRTEFEEATNG